MKRTKESMVEEILTRIEQIREHIRSIDSAASYILERYPGTEIKMGNLKDKLYNEELNEWRNLCMWGLTLDDKDRDRIKAAAHQRFLSKRMSVSHWLNHGIQPRSWLVSDEEEFREMARKEFAPRKGD